MDNNTVVMKHSLFIECIDRISFIMLRGTQYLVKIDHNQCHDNVICDVK